MVSPSLFHLTDQADASRLRTCSLEQLEVLAQEARAFLLETMQRTGGHIGAALGVVETTLALMHHYNFLKDRIVWDVGHQGHVYKMFTGRMDHFSQYGKWGGLCKFLDRQESPYDHMGAGHASTSIAAALGMAIARDLNQQNHRVIAVIGDGAMTGGLAYEALHLAGAMKLDLLVILNDNGMSIDANVGFFSRALTSVTTSPLYNLFRRQFEIIERKGTSFAITRQMTKSLKHIERSMKDYASEDKAAWFESMGWRYFGPQSGHDLTNLSALLKKVKNIQGPVVLHLLTVKGKGMGLNIENTFDAHAVSPTLATPASPKIPKATTKTLKTHHAAGNTDNGTLAPKISWSSVYSEGLLGLMKQDASVVAITAAMQSNTGLSDAARLFPDRIIDVGIAESNAYCSAAGMAIGGLKPFVTVYSTFTQRAFDQIVHDIALQNLPVRIMLDRGGFVGADGPTHHGVFDHSYLRMIPNLVHMAPRNALELRRMLLTAHQHTAGPIAMRYPRGTTHKMPLPEKMTAVPIGQGELLRDDGEGAILLIAVGSMVQHALQAAEILNEKGKLCNVLDARFIKPLDRALITEEAARAMVLLTIEENVAAGGLGEGVVSTLAVKNCLPPVRLLCAPDAFVTFGSQQEQLQAAGLTPSQIAQSALDLFLHHAKHQVRIPTKSKP